MAVTGKIHHNNSTSDDATEKSNRDHVDVKVTEEATHTRVDASAVAFPASWYEQADGAVGDVADDVIYESGDVSMYNYHSIEEMGGVASAAVQVLGSLDGTNFFGPLAVRLADATASTTHVLIIPKDKVGILLGKFSKIRVTQQSATENADARISHGVV